MFQHETGEETVRPPFDEVYRECAPRVYRFCLSILRDPNRAEDVASEVFVSAFKAYPTIKVEPERVLAWLFTIARNAAIDDIRKRKRLLSLWERLGSRPQPASPDPEGVAEMRGEVARVTAALNKLRQRERLLISLRIDGELSYAEMVPIVKMNEAAVAKATRRALDRLRQGLQEQPA